MGCSCPSWWGLAGAGVGTYAWSVTTTAERLRDARVKTDKATHSNDERTAVIELEQAGDSAKAAAEADIGVADTTRQVVLDAHLAICIAKAKLT
jgi:hypothetical protein